MTGRTVVAVTVVSPITPNQPEPISFNGFIHQTPNSPEAVTASGEMLDFFALRLVSNGNWTVNITNRMFLRFDFYRPQRSCEGYVFTRVCHSVHGGGGCCVCYPSMHCRWYPSMPGSRSLGGGAWSRGVYCGGVETPPKSRRLLFQTVCILLECILVV